MKKIIATVLVASMVLLFSGTDCKAADWECLSEDGRWYQVSTKISAWSGSAETSALRNEAGVCRWAGSCQGGKVKVMLYGYNGEDFYKIKTETVSKGDDFEKDYDSGGSFTYFYVEVKCAGVLKDTGDATLKVERPFD